MKRHACGWGGSALKRDNPTYRWVGRNVWNWSAGSCHYRGYTSYGHVIIERHCTSVFLRCSLGSEHLFYGRSRLISKSWIRINSYLDQCPWDRMDTELVHIRQELLFVLQCDRNCCRPAVEEELGWRVARPLRLHSLAESQLWIPLPAAAKPPLKAPSVLQSEVQTWTFWVCVALGLFTGPGWGLCYCLSATMFLWEVPLCFNGVFRR